MEEYMPCEPCSRKRGAYVLCESCLHNRSIIDALVRERDSFETELLICRGTIKAILDYLKEHKK